MSQSEEQAKHAHGRRFVGNTRDKRNPPLATRLAKGGNKFLDWGASQGRKLLLYAVVLGLGGLYAAHSQILSPMTVENDTTRANVIKIQKENALARTVEETHAEFQAEFKKDVLGYKDARSLLPTSLEVTNVLAQVQEAAVRNKVTLTGFDASAKADVRSTTADKLYERESPATVVGTYPQVVAFFRDVARLPRIVQVRDFALTSLRSRVSVSFKLIAYYAPPPSELPPLPADLAALLAEDDSDNESTAPATSRTGTLSVAPKNVAK